MDKSVRTNMKGKTWEDMIALDESEAVMQYALDDAKYTYQIGEKLFPDWPEEEKRLSQATRDMAWDGVPGLVNNLFDAKNSLEKKRFNGANN